jgi:hypothetical protein
MTGSLRWAAYAGPSWTPSKEQWNIILQQQQQEEERARIQRFYFEKDAKLAAVGRLMLHAAALSVLGAQPHEVIHFPLFLLLLRACAGW